MARRRWIDPSFWDDLAIAKLKPIERLFFIGCFSNADDEGRLIGNPAYLRATIFKYDDMSLEEVTEIRDHAVAMTTNLILYHANDEEYLAFRMWSKHQKPNYPKVSQHPVPPLVEESRSRSEVGAKSEQGKGADMGRVKVGLGREGLSESPKADSPKKKRKKADTPHQRTVAGYVERIPKGYSKRHKGKFTGDMKAIKQMLERGHSEETILAYYDSEKAGWWSTQHLSMRKLDENIDDWVKSGGQRGIDKRRDSEDADPLGFNADAARIQAEYDAGKR